MFVGRFIVRARSYVVCLICILPVACVWQLIMFSKRWILLIKFKHGIELKKKITRKLLLEPFNDLDLQTILMSSREPNILECKKKNSYWLKSITALSGLWWLKRNKSTVRTENIPNWQMPVCYSIILDFPDCTPCQLETVCSDNFDISIVHVFQFSNILLKLWNNVDHCTIRYFVLCDDISKKPKLWSTSSEEHEFGFQSSSNIVSIK